MNFRFPCLPRNDEGTFPESDVMRSFHFLNLVRGNVTISVKPDMSYYSFYLVKHHKKNFEYHKHDGGGGGGEGKRGRRGWKGEKEGREWRDRESTPHPEREEQNKL